MKAILNARYNFFYIKAITHVIQKIQKMNGKESFCGAM